MTLVGAVNPRFAFLGEGKIPMARVLVLAVCVTMVAPAAVLEWGETAQLAKSSAENSTALIAPVSSLGYPCDLDEFLSAGFAPEWNDGCEEPRELVFLHVPKTAGESVEAALRLKKNHTVATERRQMMGEDTWGCAFKFSVARNPWARWESWHSFCNSGYGGRHRLPVPHWACNMALTMTLSTWTKTMIAILRGLQTFPSDMTDNMMKRRSGEFELAWYFEPQSAYVTDGVNTDVLLPNFIISFENLQSDFQCMMSLLGLPGRLKHRNRSILSKGMSTAERVAAFDEEARDLIGIYNSFEIEQYGYEFPV